MKGASGGGHGQPPYAPTFSGGNEFEGLSESLGFADIRPGPCMGSQFIGTQFIVSQLMRAPSPQVAGSGERVRFSMQRQRIPFRCVKQGGTSPGVCVSPGESPPGNVGV